LIGRYRSFVRLLPALGAAGAICAAGFGLQALALYRPTELQLLASAALHKSLEYRIVRSAQVINGRRSDVVCREGWFHVGQRLRRGALLALGNGDRLLLVRHRIRPLDERTADGGTGLARVRFILAGCPSLIAASLGTRLLLDLPINAGSALIDGERALGFRFGKDDYEIELFVARDDLLPLEVRVATPRYHGRSDIQLGPPNRRLVG